MNLRTATALLSVAITLVGYAQVTTDKPIILSSPLPEARQITGLPPSATPNAVLSGAVERAGVYRTAAPAQGNVWAITLPALSTAPPAGTHLVITGPAPTAGDVDLMVNGHGPFPLTNGPGARVNGEDIPAGTQLSVVMDGTNFQLLNGRLKPRRPCIDGTVMVNADFCIEAEEHPIADLFTAISVCADQGMRLCDWGEFVVACQRATEIGMLQPTNNWEWTNDASNENNCARIVGVGSCHSAGNSFVTGDIIRNFHCCYSR